MGHTEHLFFEGVTTALQRRPVPVRSRQPVPRELPLDEDVAAFLQWLFSQVGLGHHHYRGRSLSRRLAACLRQLRVTTVMDAWKMLSEQPALVPRAIDTLLLGVTEFFRDPGVFETIRTVVLPELAKAPAPLRVWSAACSEGHELYSVAMLLAESGQLDTSMLLGTDCRPSAIKLAAAGVFDDGSLGTVAPTLQLRYFQRERHAPRVVESLRRAVCWAEHNLFDGMVPGPWDLILWRNMSIYLQESPADTLWRALARELRPGGFFITGKADHAPCDLGWSRIAPCVYRSEGSEE